MATVPTFQCRRNVTVLGFDPGYIERFINERVHDGMAKPTGFSVRLLVVPDMSWCYCSPEKLIDCEVLDFAAEFADGEWPDDEDTREYWYNAADDLTDVFNRDSSGDEMTGFRLRNVAVRDPAADHGWRFLAPWNERVAFSCDVDDEEDGEARDREDIIDEAREYACGNHMV